jgi:hypothetical protein
MPAETVRTMRWMIDLSAGLSAAEEHFRRRSQFSGRVFQMMWHIVFDARRVHSPAMEAVFLM